MRRLIAITKALADENRVRILMFLRHGELCVCRIIDMLQLAPSTVSKHLAILQQAGLVESRKAERWRYYRLPGKDAPVAVKKIISWVLDSLADDTQTHKDDQRLRAVMKKDLEDLCALYKG